jgi:hypothetical protein
MKLYIPELPPLTLDCDYKLKLFEVCSQVAELYLPFLQLYLPEYLPS